LFLSEKVKIEFENSIACYQQVSDSGKCESNDDIVGRAFVKAAKTQENVLVEDIQLESFRKLYITGHGGAGVAHTSSGDSIFTAKEVVDILEVNGILGKIKDLRFTSCGSADRRKIASVSKESIDVANRDPGIFEKLAFGGAKSFIEVLSSEIWDRGYTDVRVSGYHGAGVFYKEELPFTHLRSSTIPATDTVKRESLRVTLESDLD
ncbi:hypothetical protein, partial [Vibrio ichthyoenteri]|uniref:hypothetical protein n=1 Tax=Vibrio ichthyoenteri TaxID=142461 RepID=UPI00058667FB